MSTMEPHEGHEKIAEGQTDTKMLFLGIILRVESNWCVQFNIGETYWEELHLVDVKF